MCFWTNGYPQDSAGKHTKCLTHVGISTWVFFSSHPGSRHGDARNEHCTVTALWVIGILIMTHSVKQIHEHELRWSRTSLWKRLVTGFLWFSILKSLGFPAICCAARYVTEKIVNAFLSGAWSRIPIVVLKFCCKSKDLSMGYSQVIPKYKPQVEKLLGL